MTKLLSAVVFGLWATLVPDISAQTYVFNYQVPVQEAGIDYANPFAGGVNNPQFSPIDIDRDGDKDLFAFDRAGNVPMVFLYDAGKYTYWYQYTAIFPPLQDWAVLIDYNCDGLEDIITAFDTGIKTYKANWTGFNFEYVEDVAKLTFFEAGFFFDLPVGYIDIPGFADLDFDGDIDILTFNMTGGVVDHFKNRAIENGLPCGTWDLEHINGCWGNFYESGITYSVDLDYTCKGLTAAREGVHAGSTFLIFDEDADEDMDLVLGDLAFGVLNRLINGGDKFDAHIVDQDTTFPSYDKPYELPLFPAAFLYDVDHDGVDDMLVSPNSVNGSDTRKNVWYYKNVSADETYVFDYQTDTFLVQTMIDLGDGAYPVFFDHNNDGLQDIIVGNHSYYNDGDQVAQLALFENIGTATAPAYDLVDRNYAGLADFGFNAISPAFSDLDGDGDQDMLIGEEEGFVHFFKNIAPPDNPANFILFGANYQGIDPGQNSTPQFVDINGDGLDDLIIGERNGNVNYYANTGTAAAPIFTLENDFWGNIDVRVLGSLTGHSAPFVHMSPEGNTVYVGCEDGTIYRYTPTADFTGAFTEETAFFNNIEAGAFSTVHMADINTDGLPELITGNKRGGMQLFRDALSSPVGNRIPDQLMLYPNPAHDILYLQLSDPALAYQTVISDIQGKLIMRDAHQNGTVMYVPIADLPAGMYHIRVFAQDGMAIGQGRFIKW